MNQYASAEKPGDHYRYQSREGLQLPSGNEYKDLEEFLLRYDFVFHQDKGHFRIFRHPASGVTQRVPLVASTVGFQRQNHYWYVVRAVEAALQATGEMAPD